jgi:transcriptional regulator with XRE-family HTH domain
MPLLRGEDAKTENSDHIDRVDVDAVDDNGLRVTHRTLGTAQSLRPNSRMSVDLHVGSRIRERRLSMGISQAQLGKATRLSHQQIQKYERGANRVSASVLFALSRALKVPVAFFFEDIPPLAGSSTASAVATPDLMTTQEEEALLRLYYNIPNGIRAALFEMMKAISQSAPGDIVSAADTLLSLAKVHAEAESAAIAAKQNDAAAESEGRAMAVEIAVSVVQRKPNLRSRVARGPAGRRSASRRKSP